MAEAACEGKLKMSMQVGAYMCVGPLSNVTAQPAVNERLDLAVPCLCTLR